MNEKKFIDLIKKSLNERDQNFTIETKLNEIKKWDSLASVRVLLDLNKIFKKKSEISEIANFKSLKELYKYFNKNIND
tara:strand:- start:182 stop:415 length:234 start_codon:yes stop_codon:yes gene_type:complete